MTDNFLSCSESPLKCSQLMDIMKLYPCISCKLRLNAQIAGPGNVTKHVNGLLLNENPQTTFTINGIKHNLIESFLYFPGAHKLPGKQEQHPMEVALYFRSDDGQKHTCLCIPVQVGTGASNAYFASLNETVRNRPTIGSIISPTSQIISYRGADMRGRDGKDSRPRSQCDPVLRTVTYYILMTPADIAPVDYQRLKQIAKDSRGPPVAITELIESRFKLLSRIDGMTLVSGRTAGAAAAGDGGVSTKAMKCYRLDKTKDVINDKVYIGGTRPGSTLDKELSGTDATQADGEDSRDTSIQPGDVEKWIGIIVGSIVAILIVAFLIYVVWSGTFRNYMKVQKMYDSPLPKTFGEIQWWKVKMPSFMCPSAGAGAGAACVQK